MFAPSGANRRTYRSWCGESSSAQTAFTSNGHSLTYTLILQNAGTSSIQGFRDPPLGEDTQPFKFPEGEREELPLGSQRFDLYDPPLDFLRINIQASHLHEQLQHVMTHRYVRQEQRNRTMPLLSYLNLTGASSIPPVDGDDVVDFDDSAIQLEELEYYANKGDIPLVVEDARIAQSGADWRAWLEKKEWFDATLGLIEATEGDDIRAFMHTSKRRVSNAVG